MKLPQLLGLALVAGGCSPAEDPPRTGDGPSAGDSDFRPDSCRIDSFVTEVTGVVTDEAGNALEDARAQLCVRVSGTNELKCISPARADAAGTFAIDVPPDARCMRQAVMRVLLPSADRSTAYCVVELPTDRPTVALTEAFVLHQTTPATALPARDPADQERAVAFGGGLGAADGFELAFVPERYFGSGAGYDGLAARRLAPGAPGLCFVGDPGALDSIYAFSPEGDITGAPFAVRLANPTGLAAGRVVDLFLLGGLGCTLGDGSHVPEGDWVSIGTATVSSDEQTIEGGTVPCLNWLGVAAP